MNYRIIGTDGTELDRRSWPGHRWLQAALLEDYCEDHDYEKVKTRPNSTFTEITVTVKDKNN